MGAAELGGDLEPGVPAADHQHRSVGKAVRRAVRAAVQLQHVTAEVLRDRRRERHLEGPGGDDDLIGFVGPVGELDHEASVARADGPDAAVELDRQIEMSRVVGQVRDDIVAARVAVGLAGKREPGKAVVADGGEQLERVPASSPGGCRFAGGLEDREAASLLGEVVADREAGLAAADHEDLAIVRRRGAHGVTAITILPRTRPSARSRIASGTCSSPTTLSTLGVTDPASISARSASRSVLFDLAMNVPRR